MSDGNLLNIDPDVLFQQHSISEIGDIQKRLLHEIERKKEELRIMVGEKYRDLIEAADTIADMKITASNCVGHIDDIKVTCKKLHDSHLIGFRNDALHHTIERPIVNRTVHGIATQIKILMIIPEQIWSCIDEEDFITATQLFLFARHIHTGLQLEAGDPKVNQCISSLTSVIHRQWNSINNFNESLLNACQNKLSDEKLTPEMTASCLTSIHLLDRSKSMLDLMNTFITLHSTNYLRSILDKESDTSLTAGNLKEDIKDRISMCVRIIVRTLELLYYCFLVNDEGLIIQKLNKLLAKNSPPLLNLVNFKDPIGLKLLPVIVSEHKLSAMGELKSISKADVSQCVLNWMTWVQKYSADRVEGLLKYMNSAKSLHLIRENATRIETPDNWSDVCTALSINHHDFDIWNKYFQPLITKRLKNIITSKWTDISSSLKSKFLTLLENVTNESCNEKEININWFAWNDMVSQSFVSSEDDVIKTVNGLMKGMIMQDRGFTPNVEKYCEDFDNDIHYMLKDLKIYLYERDRKNQISSNLLLDDDLKSMNKNDKDIDRIHFDRVDIENHLLSCSTDNINKLLEFIDYQYNTKSTTDTNPLYCRTMSILSARLLQAIPILVPNLRYCFVPLQVFSVSLYDDFQMIDPAVLISWDGTCKMLNEHCHACWTRWIKIAEVQIDQFLQYLPQEFTTVANMDYLLIQWDSITIEEKDDQDQTVSSTIKIPSGPSIKVQQFLYSCGRVLDEVIPHTLPKKIHSRFVEIVAEKILSHFVKVIAEKSDEINQKCALQLLTDVRHVTLLLVTRENKKLLNDSQEICNTLREKIDPFDYNVFYPRLQVNIKRSVQRIQTLLGSLIPNNDQLNSIIGTKPLLSGGTADRDPNAFILASQGSASGTWFPLLPITTPMSNRKQVEKQRKKPTQSTINTLQKPTTAEASVSSGNASNVRSFFGSMTSDWFGN